MGVAVPVNTTMADSNTSPTTRRRTGVPSIRTVTVSPIRAPVAVSRGPPTTASPGAANQRPDTISKPSHAASPVIVVTETGSATPATAPGACVRPYLARVPGWASIAASTAAGSAVGAAAGPASGSPFTVTSATSWVSAVWMRSSDAASPVANVTAAAPVATASRIATVRAGRANGRARPRPTGLATGSRVARRNAHRPRAGPDVRPTAMASTVRSRPALSAAVHAVSVTTASTPPVASIVTHQAMVVFAEP